MYVTYKCIWQSINSLLYSFYSSVRALLLYIQSIYSMQLLRYLLGNQQTTFLQIIVILTR